jgi:hypothetical protein
MCLCRSRCVIVISNFITGLSYILLSGKGFVVILLLTDARDFEWGQVECNLFY